MQRFAEANPAGALDVPVFALLSLDEKIERDIHPVHEPAGHDCSFEIARTPSDRQSLARNQFFPQFT